MWHSLLHCAESLYSEVNLMNRPFLIHIKSCNWSAEFISVECHCEELTSEIINQQPAQSLQKRLETTRAIYFSMEFTEDRILASLSRNAEAIQRNALKASGFPEYDSLLQPTLNINTPNSINAGYLHICLKYRPAPYQSSIPTNHS